MIFDIRYHIASLVAIFLALGIGILIGTSMIGSDTFAKQQKKMIDSIEQEFTVLREENKKNSDALTEVQAVIASQQQFNQAVLPVLVRGKLQERKIALVDLNYRKEHDALANVLRTAGADFQSITVVNLNDLKDPLVSKQIAAMLGKTNKDTAPDKYLPDLARLFASAVATGENGELIRFLDDNELIKISGTYGPPLQDIIIIGGSENKEQDFARKFDLVMVKTWQKNGISVYGVEDTDTLVSYMSYYQSARLTTVDNIDTVYGQVSLVQAMSGYPGHYGVKQTAETFLPPLE